MTRNEQLRAQADRNRAISETYAAEGNAEMAAFWEGQAVACEAEMAAEYLSAVLAKFPWRDGANDFPAREGLEGNEAGHVGAAESGLPVVSGGDAGGGFPAARGLHGAVPLAGRGGEAMTLAFALTRCARRKRRLTRMTWVTRLTVFLLTSAVCGWLLTFIKHAL